MGKITEIFYKELESNVMDLTTAGEFYYLFNLVDVDSRFHEDFEKSEMNQIVTRNKVVGDIKRGADMDKNINMSSSILAVSSLKNKVIVFVNVE